MYNTLVTFAICANTAQERERAVNLVARLLGAATQLNGYGLWLGESEESVQIQYWLNGDEPAEINRAWRALRALRLLQVALQQQAMFVSVISPHGIWADAIYADGWTEALDSILPLIDRGEYLCRFFHV